MSIKKFVLSLCGLVLVPVCAHASRYGVVTDLTTGVSTLTVPGSIQVFSSTRSNISAFEITAGSITKALSANFSGAVSASNFSGGSVDSLLLFQSTAQVKIDDLYVFKSTAQTKIDDLYVFKSTAQVKIDDLYVFKSTAQTKLDNLGISTTSSQSQLDNVVLATTSLGSSKVPYSGATGNVNLGSYSLMASSSEFTNTSGSGLKVSSSAYFCTAGGLVGVGTGTPVGLLDLNSDSMYFQNSRFIYGNSTNFNTCLGIGVSTSGLYNASLGYNSHGSNATGSNDVAVGYNSLNRDTGGTNTAVGYSALYLNSTGNSNTGVGYTAAYSNTKGVQNTAVGSEALNINSTNSRNTAIGYDAGYGCTGGGNTILGYYSGRNVSGSSNTIVGANVGTNLTSGNQNIIIGSNLELNNNTTNNQVVIATAPFFYGTYDTVYSTNNKIGIGTNSPSSMLEINGGSITISGPGCGLAVNSSSQNTAFNVLGSTNNYFQANIKNSSNGVIASSDWVATADNGTESSHYIDMGINGSGGGGVPFSATNHAYLYASDDSLNIGALGNGATMFFYTTGGIAAPVERLRIQSTGNIGIGTNSPSSLLDINGGSVTIRGTGAGLNVSANTTFGSVPSLPAQSSHTVLIGPASGADSSPTFRSLNGFESGLVFIASAVASNSASISFSNFDNKKYYAYKLRVVGSSPVSNAVNLRLRVSSETAVITTAYAWALQGGKSSSVLSDGAASTDIGIYLGVGADSQATNSFANYDITWVGNSENTLISGCTFTGMYYGSTLFSVCGAGYRYPMNVDPTGFEFSYHAGNIAYGSFYLYGFVK